VEEEEQGRLPETLKLIEACSQLAAIRARDHAILNLEVLSGADGFKEIDDLLKSLACLFGILILDPCPCAPDELKKYLAMKIEDETIPANRSPRHEAQNRLRELGVTG